MSLIDRWFKKERDEHLKEKAKEPQIKDTKKVVPAAKKDNKEKIMPAAVSPKTEGEVHKVKMESAAYRILARPLVTEKSAVMGSRNKYVFIVNRSANKEDVRRAVEDVYGVKPEKVNIINMSGHVTLRRGAGRAGGRRSDFKKAIVTLVSGQSIAVHEGV